MKAKERMSWFKINFGGRIHGTLQDLLVMGELGEGGALPGFWVPDGECHRKS